MFKNRFSLVFILFVSLTNPCLAEYKLSLSTPASNLSVLPLIAEKKGFFKELNLDVEIKKTQSGKMSLDAIISNNAEVGLIVDTNIAFINFNPNNLKIIGTIGTRLDNQILYRIDKNINSPSDLKLKRIAYLPGTSSHIYLHKFLNANNISWSEIIPVPLQVQAMLPALKGKQVDAVSIWEPWANNITKELDKEIKALDIIPSIYPSRSYIGTTEKILNSKKKELEFFLLGLEKARLYFLSNKNEIYNLIAKEIGATPDQMPIITKDHYYDIDFNTQMIELIKEDGEWIKETQTDFKDLPLPNYNNIFTDIVFNEFNKNQKKETIKINICRPNNMIASLLFIAEAKNFYQEEKLDAHFETATNAKICLDILTSGKADVTSGAEGPFTSIATSNPEISIIAKTQDNPEISLFARNDKGISKLEDIKGKKVGYLPGTASYYYLSRLLKTNNLKKEDLKLISLQPPAMSAALIGGMIDAACIWEPWGSKALLELKENGMSFNNPELYSQRSLLYMSNKFLDKNPDASIRLIKTLNKAKEFINHNKEESIKILSKVLSFDQEILDKLWYKYKHEILLEDKFIIQMEENFDLLKENDENFKDIKLPNYRKYINSKSLKTVLPEKVFINY